MNQNREDARQAIARAQAAGCSALVFTVDAQLNGKRDGDVRNGYTGEVRVSLANVLDMLGRVAWMGDVLLGPRLTFGNYLGGDKTRYLPLARLMARSQDATVSWKEVDWVRSLWSGPLVIKGALTPEDTQLAVEHGADGIVVSNHGGRQLDGAPSSISVPPSIAQAIGGRATVLFDSGIRRGQDIIKAIALGADACLIGRDYINARGVAGVIFRSIRLPL